MITFCALLLSFACLDLLLRRRRAMPRARAALLGGLGAALLVVAALAAPTGLVLQKAIGRALMPLGLFWCGLLAAALWRFHRGDGRSALRWSSLFLVVTLLGNEPLATAMIARLEAPYAAPPLQVEPLQAVFVLGGGADDGPGGTFELGPSGDRVALGARLYHRGRTPLLVTSGTPIEGLAGAFDSTIATTTLWRDLGVPDAAIVALRGTRNTSEEAKQAAALARREGWTRVGLVTSAWHMRRAEGLFAREGLRVVPLAADHRGEAGWEGLLSVVPTGAGAAHWHTLAWEVLGAAVGR